MCRKTMIMRTASCPMNRMMKLSLTILLFVIISFAETGNAAKTYININDPFIRKIPVAVPAFKAFSSYGNEVTDGGNARKILSEALEFTGYIKIMDPAAFLEDPSQTGITRAEINFRNWTAIGGELLVTGGIQEIDGGVKLQLRLFDTFKERLLIGKVYSGDRTTIRTMIHRFCGEISYYLTGKWGVFTSQIAFVSTVNRNKEIFVCDFDGFGVKQFTFHKSITLSPAWSSEGDWIAYTSYANKKPDIYIQHTRDNRGSVVGFKGINITPDWMPGQFALAACLSFSGDQEIYLLTGKGEIIKKLTDSWDIDVSPTFSPDGKEVAFVSRRSGTPQIYIQSIDTGFARRLTFHGDYNTSPSWSPDGDRLAYAGSENGQLNIYTIGTDGRTLLQLTQDAGDNEDPCWSPDGSLLVFSSNREGLSRLFVMTSNGGEQRRLLTMEGAQTGPAWSRGKADH